MNYRISLYLLLSLVVGVAGYAQDERPQPQLQNSTPINMAQKDVQTLKALLRLTETQSNQIETIETKLYGEYVSLVRMSLPGAERKKRIQDLQNDKSEAFMKILTPPQWVSYSTYVKQKQIKEKEKIEDRRRQQQADSSGTNG